MTIMKRYLLAGTAMAFGILAAACPVRAETLGQAIESALSTHPGVHAALADRDALAQDHNEKRSDYFPKLQANGSYGRQYADNSTSRGLSVSRGAGYSWHGDGSVTVSQHIFDGLSTESRSAAAADRHESANYNVVDVREDLAMKMSLAYMDVLRSRESIVLLDGHSKKIDEYISRIEKMVKDGAADKSMIVQAQDIKAQLERTRYDLVAQLDSAAADYTELAGHPPDEEMKRPDDKAAGMPPSVDEAVAQAVKQHPALKAASYTAEAGAMDARAERLSFLPDVKAEASYTKIDQRDLIGGESVDARALLKMNWAYDIGGAQIARYRKALYREAQSKAQRDTRQRQIEKNIRVSYSKIDAARKQLENADERLKLNEALLENYQAQFEGGRVTQLQLLQTENALFNNRLNQVNGIYKLIAAQYSALANMGMLQTALNVVPAASDAR